MNQTFIQFFEENKERIYSHIHDLAIKDHHKIYFVEGVVALWLGWKLLYHENHSINLDTIIRARLVEKYNGRKK